jgi:hypothetical protein
MKDSYGTLLEENKTHLEYIAVLEKKNEDLENQFN